MGVGGISEMSMLRRGAVVERERLGRGLALCTGNWVVKRAGNEEDVQSSGGRGAGNAAGRGETLGEDSAAALQGRADGACEGRHGDDDGGGLLKPRCVCVSM